MPLKNIPIVPRVVRPHGSLITGTHSALPGTMNRLLELDTQNLTVLVEAGMTTRNFLIALMLVFFILLIQVQ